MLQHALTCLNKTEQVAYEWLEKQGHKDIVFRTRDTPDFVTSKGFFEIKRAMGNTILFQNDQIDRIRECEGKVLVFRDNEIEPAAILDSSELIEGDEPVSGGFIVKISEYESIKISEKTKALLDGLKVHPRQPYDEVIGDAATVYGAMKTVVVGADLTKLGVSKEQAEAVSRILFGRWHP